MLHTPQPRWQIKTAKKAPVNLQSCNGHQELWKMRRARMFQCRSLDVLSKPAVIWLVYTLGINLQVKLFGYDIQEVRVNWEGKCSSNCSYRVHFLYLFCKHKLVWNKLLRQPLWNVIHSSLGKWFQKESICHIFSNSGLGFYLPQLQRVWGLHWWQAFTWESSLILIPPVLLYSYFSTKSPCFLICFCFLDWPPQKILIGKKK